MRGATGTGDGRGRSPRSKTQPTCPANKKAATSKKRPRDQPAGIGLAALIERVGRGKWMACGPLFDREDHVSNAGLPGPLGQLVEGVQVGLPVALDGQSQRFGFARGRLEARSQFALQLPLPHDLVVIKILPQEIDRDDDGGIIRAQEVPRAAGKLDLKNTIDNVGCALRDFRRGVESTRRSNGGPAGELAKAARSRLVSAGE